MSAVNTHLYAKPLGERSIHLFNFSGDVDCRADSIDRIGECRHNFISNRFYNRTGMTGNGSSQSGKMPANQVVALYISDRIVKRGRIFQVRNKKSDILDANAL